MRSLDSNIRYKTINQNVCVYLIFIKIYFINLYCISLLFDLLSYRKKNFNKISPFIIEDTNKSQSHLFDKQKIQSLVNLFLSQSK
jgi:hypothetical protein